MSDRPCEICFPDRRCFCTEDEMADEPGCPFKSNTPNSVEPPPIKNDHPAVWDLVLADIQERDQIGFKKYGVRLQPFNGRDSLIDAYQEALDLVVYLRQEIFQRYGK